MSHAHNTMKIALNDAETLKELIKDPEVVVRCKDAIVKGVAKYVLNAAQQELNKSIEDFVRQAIDEYCNPAKGKESEWFKSADQWYKVCLTKTARETIKAAVQQTLIRQCQDVVDNVAGNEVEKELEMAVASKLQQIGEFDVEKAFKERLDKYIWERLVRSNPDR